MDTLRCVMPFSEATESIPLTVKTQFPGKPLATSAVAVGWMPPQSSDER